MSSNSFSVTLSDGTVLQGDVQPDLRREGRHFVVKCFDFDLKSACRQWALAPFTEPFAVTSVWNPTESRPELFQQCALPFGARSTVRHFNWVARMILHVILETVALKSEATSLSKCVDFFFALMGWSLKDTPAFQQECPAPSVLIDLGGVRAGHTQIRNTDARLDELNNTIREIGRRRPIAPQEAPVLPRTNSFTKIGAPAIRNLVQIADPQDASQCVLDTTIASLQLLVHNLKIIRTRVIRPACGENILPFTDGACEGGRGSTGAALFHPTRGVNSFELRVDNDIIKHWQRHGKN